MPDTRHPPYPAHLPRIAALCGRLEERTRALLRDDDGSMSAVELRAAIDASYALFSRAYDLYEHAQTTTFGAVLSEPELLSSRQCARIVCRVVRAHAHDRHAAFCAALEAVFARLDINYRDLAHELNRATVLETRADRRSRTEYADSATWNAAKLLLNHRLLARAVIDLAWETMPHTCAALLAR